MESSCIGKSKEGVVFYGNFYLTYLLIKSRVFWPIPDLIYTQAGSISLAVNL